VRSLGVVAGRKRDYAGLALPGRELRQRVVGSAELEGAHALEVLALENSSAPVSSLAVREVITGVR